MTKYGGKDERKEKEGQGKKRFEINKIVSLIFLQFHSYLIWRIKTLKMDQFLDKFLGFNFLSYFLYQSK